MRPIQFAENVVLTALEQIGAGIGFELPQKDLTTDSASLIT
jgi:hypothetical protein